MVRVLPAALHLLGYGRLIACGFLLILCGGRRALSFSFDGKSVTLTAEETESLAASVALTDLANVAVVTCQEYNITRGCRSLFQQLVLQYAKTDTNVAARGIIQAHKDFGRLYTNHLLAREGIDRTSTTLEVVESTFNMYRRDCSGRLAGLSQVRLLLCVSHYREDLSWLPSTRTPFVLASKTLWDAPEAVGVGVGVDMDVGADVGVDMGIGKGVGMGVGMEVEVGDTGGEAAAQDCPSAHREAGLHVPVNSGNEVSSYLLYVTEYYHTLPEFTLFLHGHSEDWHQFYPVRFIVEHLSLQPYENVNNWLVNDRNTSNVHMRTLQSLWKELFQEDLGDFPHSQTGSAVFHEKCCAQFAVHRDRIRLRPLAFYKKLYDFVVNSAQGNDAFAVDGYHTSMSYVMEFVWHYIFGEPTRKHYEEDMYVKLDDHMHVYL